MEPLKSWRNLNRDQIDFAKLPLEARDDFDAYHDLAGINHVLDAQLAARVAEGFLQAGQVQSARTMADYAQRRAEDVLGLAALKVANQHGPRQTYS